MLDGQMKSNLTTAYLMFVFEFAEPDFEKAPLLEKLGAAIEDIFDKQKSIDKAKKDLTKKEFGQALFLYFNHFQSADGFDYSRLAQKIEEHKANFLRHLGKDKLSYLNLIISLMRSVNVKKKGLLAA